MTDTTSSQSVDIHSFTTLDQVRHHIDTLDHQLIRLFNRRMSTALQLHQLTQHDAVSPTAAAAHARRSTLTTSIQSPSGNTQQQLLDTVTQHNKQINGPCNDTAVRAIYTEVQTAAEILQRRRTVALACETGDIMHHTAIQYYKHIDPSIEITCVADTATVQQHNTSVRAVWAAVETRAAQYGMVPLWLNDTNVNTTTNGTVDMLSSNENHLDIYAELLYTAEYVLCGHHNHQIKTIYGQPSVIAVCQPYISKYLPDVDIIVEHSLRHACIQTQQSKHCAVLAGRLAAELYGLQVLQLDGMTAAAHGSSSSSDVVGVERCRSIVLAPRSGPSTGADKTFVSFAVRDQSGDLHDALAAFKQNNVSLTRIESRASRDRVKIWDYAFLAEFSGHHSDTEVQDALQKLEKQSRFVKVLGSCPTVNLDTHATENGKLK